METGDFEGNRERVAGYPLRGTPALPSRAQRQFTHRKFQKGGFRGVAKARKTVVAVKDETRLDKLKKLEKMIADQMDACASDPEGTRYLPQLAKQYRETLKEIEEIEGVKEENDEIGELLSARQADGKSKPVRQNRS